MPRTNFMKNFDLFFQIPFSTVIRGRHIYKTIWTAVVGRELIAKLDERKEALNYDKFSIGVFKPKEEEANMNTSDSFALVGHVPIEMSSLSCYFLKVDKDNAIHVKVNGDRKRKVGLIVPRRYSVRTKNPRTARILDEELQKKKRMFSTLELKHKKKGVYRKFLVH